VSIGYLIMTYFDCIPRNLHFGEGVKRPKPNKPTEYNCYGEPLNNFNNEPEQDDLVLPEPS